MRPLSSVRYDIGVSMQPDYLVAEDLAAGRLVRLLPEFYFERAPLQLVYLPYRHMTPKMKSFVYLDVQHFARGQL
jgi:DNA-binding transcriptional LysR family regulator